MSERMKPGNRFDRRGNVIPDRRRMSDLWGTDAYQKGDPLFAPRRSTPARKRWQARHNRVKQLRASVGRAS